MPTNISSKAYLLRQLALRDIQSKHKGTFGGVFWLVGQPLLMLGIYTLVFGLIFQPKWIGIDSIWDFSLILFLGKIPYIYVLDAVGRAPSLMAGHIGYVKKTQFPLELLVVMSQISALFVVVMSLFVWVIFYCVIHKGVPPLALLSMPVVYLPLYLAVTGISYFLASLGAYFKDVAHIVQPLLFSLMFLSPVFYPLDQSPGWLGQFLKWNPMSQVIEQSRALLYFGHPFDWRWWLQQLVLGVALVALGKLWFRKTRSGFAEVL